MLKKVTQNLSRQAFLGMANSIPDSAKERIETPLNQIIFHNPVIKNNNKLFIDVHAHSFTIDHIPKDFIKLLNWLPNNDKIKFTKWFADKEFGNFLGMDSSKKVMDALVETYDSFFAAQGITPHLLIVNLCLDMERGITGKPVSDYNQQIQQVLQFRKQSSPVFGSGLQYDYKTTVLPFLSIDANNPMAFEYFLSAFIKNYNTTGISELDNEAPFIGVKLYPSMGYVPENPVILDILEICEQKAIPVTTHCGGIRTRTNSRNIELSYRDTQNGISTDKIRNVSVHSKQNFKNIFLDPLHWKRVMERYPKLKLNLAHFGDNKEWDNFQKNKNDFSNFIFKTLEMMQHYNNVYADISYSYYSPINRQLIKEMMSSPIYKHKIMNGSDFFLNELEQGKTSDFISALKNDFRNQDEGWNGLTNHNPYRFLFEDPF